MMNEIMIREMEQRRRDLMRAAKMQTLLYEARRDTPHMGDRLMLLLSDVMISSGQRLRKRISQRPSAAWRDVSVEYPL